MHLAWWPIWWETWWEKEKPFSPKELSMPMGREAFADHWCWFLESIQKISVLLASSEALLQKWEQEYQTAMQWEKVPIWFKPHTLSHLKDLPRDEASFDKYRQQYWWSHHWYGFDNYINYQYWLYLKEFSWDHYSSAYFVSQKHHYLFDNDFLSYVSENIKNTWKISERSLGELYKEYLTPQEASRKESTVSAIDIHTNKASHDIWSVLQKKIKNGAHSIRKTVASVVEKPKTYLFKKKYTIIARALLAWCTIKLYGDEKVDVMNPVGKRKEDTEDYLSGQHIYGVKEALNTAFAMMKYDSLNNSYHYTIEDNQGKFIQRVVTSQQKEILFQFADTVGQHMSSVTVPRILEPSPQTVSRLHLTRDSIRDMLNDNQFFRSTNVYFTDLGNNVWGVSFGQNIALNIHGVSSIEELLSTFTHEFHHRLSDHGDLITTEWGTHLNESHASLSSAESFRHHSYASFALSYMILVHNMHESYKSLPNTYIWWESEMREYRWSELQKTNPQQEIMGDILATYPNHTISHMLAISTLDIEIQNRLYALHTAEKLDAHNEKDQQHVADILWWDRDATPDGVIEMFIDELTPYFSSWLRQTLHHVHQEWLSDGDIKESLVEYIEAHDELLGEEFEIDVIMEQLGGELWTTIQDINNKWQWVNPDISLFLVRILTLISFAIWYLWGVLQIWSYYLFMKNRSKTYTTYKKIMEQQNKTYIYDTFHHFRRKDLFHEKADYREPFTLFYWIGWIGGLISQNHGSYSIFGWLLFISLYIASIIANFKKRKERYEKRLQWQIDLIQNLENPTTEQLQVLDIPMDRPWKNNKALQNLFTYFVSDKEYYEKHKKNGTKSITYRIQNNFPKNLTPYIHEEEVTESIRYDKKRPLAWKGRDISYKSGAAWDIGYMVQQHEKKSIYFMINIQPWVPDSSRLSIQEWDNGIRKDIDLRTFWARELSIKTHFATLEAKYMYALEKVPPDVTPYLSFYTWSDIKNDRVMATYPVTKKTKWDVLTKLKESYKKQYDIYLSLFHKDEEERESRTTLPSWDRTSVHRLLAQLPTKARPLMIWHYQPYEEKELFQKCVDGNPEEEKKYSGEIGEKIPKQIRYLW